MWGLGGVSVWRDGGRAVFVVCVFLLVLFFGRCMMVLRGALGVMFYETGFWMDGEGHSTC